MPFDLLKIAAAHGFDDAYLVPEIVIENASLYGLRNLKEIMPEAKSVLLLVKKHNSFKPFPESSMTVHSHYPAYQSAFVLHKSLIVKMVSMGIAARSADMLPLKPYAVAAGLTRLRNSLTYHENFGSYFVLQAVAVTQEISYIANTQKDLCADCRKCVDACPTGAIKMSGGIDREKCIRNHVPVKEFISENIRLASKTGLIGCGICQAVCPLNANIERVEPPGELSMASDIEGILDIKKDSVNIKKLQELIGKNEARPGRTIATACVAAGNSGQKKYSPYLEAILSAHTNPLVRGYSAWALGRIGGSRAVLKKALETELDMGVKKEITEALSY